MGGGSLLPSDISFTVTLFFFAYSLDAHIELQCLEFLLLLRGTTEESTSPWTQPKINNLLALSPI